MKKKESTDGKEKLLLAFEFGIVISEVAKNMKQDLTPKIVKKSEEILAAEMDKGSAKDFACQMQILALAAFEIVDKKTA